MDEYPDTYQGKLQERADLVRASESLFSLCRAEGRQMTAAERSADDRRSARMGELMIAISEEEAQREAKRSAALGIVPPGAPGMAQFKGPARSARYADLFPQLAHESLGFKSWDEFSQVLASGLFDPRMRPVATLDYGDGAGYLIPPQYAMQLLDASLEDEIVRPRAQAHPMTSDQKVIAGFSLTDSSTGDPYGLAGGWTAPGQEIVEGEPMVTALVLRAKKLAILTEVLNEIVADAAGFGNQLGSTMRESMSWHLDNDFINGNGVGRPLGILHAPALVVVPKTGGQTADTITAANILAMFARLAPRSHPKAVWLANPTAMPQLGTLVLGTDTLLLQQVGEGKFFMLGKEVIFTEKVPVLGNQGDISLVDFSQYAVGMRAEVAIETSQHLGFKKDTTWYRGKLRADGLPLWSAAYTPLNGSTVSPYVALAERA